MQGGMPQRRQPPHKLRRSASVPQQRRATRKMEPTEPRQACKGCYAPLTPVAAADSSIFKAVALDESAGALTINAEDSETPCGSPNPERAPCWHTDGLGGLPMEGMSDYALVMANCSPEEHARSEHLQASPSSSGAPVLHEGPT